MTDSDLLKKIRDDEKKKIEILEDMIEEKTRSLYQALENAEKLSQIKSEFLMFMSHEFRTPMNGILNLSEIAKLKLQKGMYDQVEKFLDDIHFSGQKLMLLLNDLLDFSKLEKEENHLELEKHDLFETINKVVLDFSPILKSKKMSSKLETVDCKIFTAIYDQKKIAKALKCILIHCMNSSPDQSNIDVILSNTSEQESQPKNKYLEIKIKDEGPQIPKEKLLDIFEQCKRSRQSKLGMEYDLQGSGIELMIAKKIIQDHQGFIWVENDKNGSGVSFHINIPIFKP